MPTDRSENRPVDKLPEPYYQDDSVTLYHADNRDVLPHLSGVGQVVTSPPYNLNGDGNNSAGTYFHRLADGYASHSDDMPHSEYVKWQHELLHMLWATLTGTGLDVAEHQRLTVTNFIELRSIAPDLPIIPVLQGWQPWEYEHCAEMYEAAGVDLAAEPVVGIGSVCRRTPLDHRVAERSIRRIAPHVGPLHGFGVSLDGLDMYGDALGSSDSLAWSFWARADGAHILDCDQPLSRSGEPYSVANCPGCALAYRREVVRRAELGTFGHPAWEQLEMEYAR